jgi:16S rRNA (uracil1498-N3)-methyltransferase
MTRRRFFADPANFKLAHKQVELTSDEARHLREVLRLKPGDKVYVFDGKGKEFLCAVHTAAREFADLEILEEVEPARPESPLKLLLAVALLKGEKFDLAVQKATELGVRQIIPLVTRHSDIRLRDEGDGLKRVMRWQRIAIEAAKQSGRAFVPQITPPLTLAYLLDDPLAPESLQLLFSERGGESLAMATAAVSDIQSVTAMVGSEGGWSDEEIEQARAAGAKVVTLGGRVLRAETAAIAVTTLLQHLYGDLR